MLLTVSGEFYRVDLIGHIKGLINGNGTVFVQLDVLARETARSRLISSPACTLPQSARSFSNSVHCLREVGRLSSHRQCHPRGHLNLLCGEEGKHTDPPGFEHNRNLELAGARGVGTKPVVRPSSRKQVFSKRSSCLG